MSDGERYPMPKPVIDADEAVRLYVEKEWSVREIAQRFDTSYGRVYGVLRNRVVMRGRNGMGTHAHRERLRVAAVMRERIVTGDWPPNRKILGEQDMARIFDVGVYAVRGAIADLRRGGYLRTVPGKGTYTRPRSDWCGGGEAR